MAVDAAARREAIRRLLQTRRVHNQQELAELLEAEGLQATQATLSRDLKALRVAKVPGEDGYVYRLPEAVAVEQPAPEERVRFELVAFITGVKQVNNLVLLRTPPGSAAGVGRALDQLGWTEIEGTIAGDDTLLVVMNTKGQAKKFVQKLSQITRRGLD